MSDVNGNFTRKQWGNSWAVSSRALSLAEPKGRVGSPPRRPCVLGRDPQKRPLLRGWSRAPVCLPSSSRTSISFRYI